MEIIKTKIEKYFKGTATEEEVYQVLTWFKSREGQEYLNKNYDRDLRNLKKLDKTFAVQSDPRRTLTCISRRTDTKATPLKLVKKPRRRSSVWAVAASILFLVSAITVFELYQRAGMHETEQPVSMNVFSTDQEQKLLTLSDGSRIRLNNNSRIEMSDNALSDKRTVKLDGEAFFEITHNPERPFIVNTGSAEIRVLGTSFNVKTNPHRKDIYVTVSDGRVSLSSSIKENNLKVLEEGMIGILDAQTNEIKSKSLDVSNYLSWMHGRIIFNSTPFDQVITQLEHIYDMDSIVEDKEILQMELTTNFSGISRENVLSVIAEGLEIEYRIEGHTVVWSL